MLTPDFDYIFLAPVPTWRGIRLYTEPFNPSQHFTPQLGALNFQPMIIQQVPSKLARRPRSPSTGKRPQPAV